MIGDVLLRDAGSETRAGGTLALASAVILAAAYVLEYGGGLVPCELCLYQRLPHWGALGVALVIVGLGYRCPAVARPLLLLTTLIYAGGGALALFHVGVEQHWWPGPASCAAAPAGDSYEAFRANILTQPVVRCDAPAATFLGLSLAAYNALASAALAVFAFWAWRRPRWGTQVREISA